MKSATPLVSAIVVVIVRGRHSKACSTTALSMHAWGKARSVTVKVTYARKMACSKIIKSMHA